MNWEVVTIRNEAKGRTSPYASVGFGRLGLSVGACKLIDDYQSYSYAEFLRGKKDGKLCIGVRFLKASERTDNALPLKQKAMKGQRVGGFEIASKGTLEDLFGPAASAKKSTRYNVTLDADDPNVLIIFAK